MAWHVFGLILASLAPIRTILISLQEEPELVKQNKYHFCSPIGVCVINVFNSLLGIGKIFFTLSVQV